MTDRKILTPAQRRVLVQYPKRATARGMMQQDRSHLV